MNEWLEVCFRVTGLGAEKLLNEARKRGLRLSQVKRNQDRALTVRCSPKTCAAFQELARERGFQVEPARPVGLLRFFKALGKRWGLLAGAALCAVALFWSMGFIWQVRVENAGAYAGEVRVYLEELGVKPGVQRRGLDLAVLREKLEWRLPKVKWVQVEYAGVALRVRLEEGVPPPEVESAGAAGDVVAQEDGVLSRLTTYAGTPVAKAGELVHAGQVLITGAERGPNGEMVPVKAQGEAIARIWVSTQARVPLEETLSQPTGREETRRVLVTPFFSWSTQGTPDYLTCDRDVTETTVGGAWLPLVLRRETYLEVALEKERRDEDTVKGEAARAALRLLREITAGQNVIDKFVE